MFKNKGSHVYRNKSKYENSVSPNRHINEEIKTIQRNQIEILRFKCKITKMKFSLGGGGQEWGEENEKEDLSR